MSAIGIGALVFACVFGGAVAGLLLRAVLPEHHLASESKEVVKLSMGLVATMSALVLGLLVASAKSSFDTQGNEVTDLSAKVEMLDRVLARYGPGAQEARAHLKTVASTVLAHMEGSDSSRPADVEAPNAAGEALFQQLYALTPKSEEETQAKSKAIDIGMQISQQRWLMFSQRATTFSTPLLVMVVCWLTVIFMSFGLYTKANATVTVALAIAALSVSAAMFLILEMYSPYSGLIHISMAPLRTALAHLGQ